MVLLLRVWWGPLPLDAGDAGHDHEVCIGAVGSECAG